MPKAKETDKTREQRVKTVTSLRQQIAALERTVELLQKERDTFFSILERAPYGVVLLDKDGKTVFTNTAFTTITGYTLEDVPTTSDWVRLAYPDKQYRDEISASETWKRNKAQRETNGLFQKMLNRVFFRSFSVMCKDGTVKEIEFNPSALDDGSTVVTLADSTERKRAEEAFRESEKQFRLLVQHVPDILSVHDIDGNIIDMNQQACESLGYTRDELFGLRVQDIEQNFIVSKHAEQWKRMVPGVPILLHGVHKRKNGTTFPVEIRIGMFESGGKKLFLALVRDITERKQAEAAVRESEERFRTLVETMKVGLTTIDEKGVLTYANEQFCTILGYSTDEVIGRPTVDFYYDDETRKSQEEVFAKRKKGMRDPTPYEIAWKTKDGKKVYTILSPTPNFDADGRYIGSYAIQTDITERKQAEEALRESENRFRLLVEHSVDAFILHDVDGRILDVNQHACDSLGYTREELLNMFIEDIDEDVIPGKHKEQWKHMVPGVPITLEGVHRRKDGTTFPVEVRLVAFKSGGCKLILSLVRDITERKQAEEALRESEKRYRQIVDNADDIIYGVDHRGHFSLINPVAARITRYSEHELIGRHYLDLVNPAYRKDTERFYRLQFVRKRQNTYYELPIITKDGTEVWLGQNVQLVVEGGRVVGYQAVARDITNRKRAEDTIRELAYQDALTGLPNRVLFNDRFSMALAQARRHQQRLGIMLLDLDHFKGINDTLGHSVGDKLLRVVGERLTGLLRTSDTIARMGGDEFLLLLTEIARLNDVITIAQKILRVFQNPFVIDDHEIIITTSIGITIFPDDGDTADVLLKNADIAMYLAKERGRDNFQCYSSAPR